MLKKYTKKMFLDYASAFDYYDDILSSLHNFVKGGEFYPIKIKN